MPKISGSFAGNVKWGTTASMPDRENHVLGLVEIGGTQSTADAHWNGAAITYWGMADLTDGGGPQRGYFLNVHGEGDRDYGHFEGKITTAGEQVTLEGTWQYMGGTGTYKNLTGGGTYRGRMVSPTAVQVDWQGEYHL